MEKIIYNYLDRNYRITLSTYNSYMLYNKKSKRDETLKSVMCLMVDIFSTNEEFIYTAFEKWCDKETLIINNKVVEIQDKIYLKTGKVIQLSPQELNDYLLNGCLKNESDFY